MANNYVIKRLGNVSWNSPRTFSRSKTVVLVDDKLSSWPLLILFIFFILLFSLGDLERLLLLSLNSDSEKESCDWDLLLKLSELFDLDLFWCLCLDLELDLDLERDLEYFWLFDLYEEDLDLLRDLLWEDERELDLLSLYLSRDLDDSRDDLWLCDLLLGDDRLLWWELL